MVTAWKQCSGCEDGEKRRASEVILPADPRGSRAAQHHLHWQCFASPARPPSFSASLNTSLLQVCHTSVPLLSQSPISQGAKSDPVPLPRSSCILISQPCLASPALCSHPLSSFSCSPPRTSLHSLISLFLMSSLTDPSPIPALLFHRFSPPLEHSPKSKFSLSL